MRKRRRKETLCGRKTLTLTRTLGNYIEKLILGKLLKHISALTLAILVLGLRANAGPAWRGTLTLTQPDGSVLQARVVGDEFAHLMVDLQGNALIQNSEGWWCYAAFSGDGSMHSTGTVAGDKLRPASAAGGYIGEVLRKWSAQNKRALVRNPLVATKGGQVAGAWKKAGSSSGTGAGWTRNCAGEGAASGSEAEAKSDTEAGSGGTGSNAPEVIRKRCLVLLAEFKDLKMSFTQERFENLMNTGEASVRKYLDDQFLGRYDFVFDVAPIVTLSQAHQYYGKNSNGKDSRAAEAVAEACRLAAANGTDFSIYDTDNDGKVDDILLFYAGKDESEGGGDDCIWSHAWKLSAANIKLTLNGKVIDSYAATSELSLRSSGKYQFKTIGTICHEYSHSLGLADMYDTDYGGSGGEADGLWKSTALMDKGNFNNDGRTPPYYNAIDRDMLGIGQCEELKEGHYVLEPINLNGRFLRMDTANEGEYYLIECRTNTGWDIYTRCKGLAIYHIDKSANFTGYSPVYERDASAAERWTSNEVNCRPQHQCADMIESLDKANDISQIMWPYGKNNSFTPQSSPSFTLWDGSSSPLSITDILQIGDNVSFNVVKSESANPEKAIDIRRDIYQDIAIIQWKTDVPGSTSPAFILIGEKGKSETGEMTVNAFEPGKYAIRLEGLKPATTYTMKIHYEASGVKGEVVNVQFSTKKIYREGYPFIFLNTVKRNEDGSFPAGSMLPLVLLNANKFKAVEWYMDDRSIIADKNGYFKLTRSCKIKAVILYIDGSKEIIEKSMRVK